MHSLTGTEKWNGFDDSLLHRPSIHQSVGVIEFLMGLDKYNPAAKESSSLRWAPPRLRLYRPDPPNELSCCCRPHGHTQPKKPSSPRASERAARRKAPAEGEDVAVTSSLRRRQEDLIRPAPRPLLRVSADEKIYAQHRRRSRSLPSCPFFPRLSLSLSLCAQKKKRVPFPPNFARLCFCVPIPSSRS